MSCTHCEKKCLSFLVLRPSPIPREKVFRWPLSNVNKMVHFWPESNIKNAPPGWAACNGPQPGNGLELENSTIALRLLRRGYLHIYMPEASAGVDKWRIYHVDEKACMRLIGPGFSPPAVDEEVKPCTTAGHDPWGQMLITIPNASKMKVIWLAFSANLWSNKLKEQNAGNPEAMVKLDLEAGENNRIAFKPTVEKLKEWVLECAADKLYADIEGGKPVEPNYPFNPLIGTNHDDSRVRHLADALSKAAASSPTTKGKELAVVVPDPIALKRELSAIRLLIQRTLLMPLPREEMQLRTHYQLVGMAETVADATDSREFSPLATRSYYEARQKELKTRGPTQFTGWDEGRIWIPFDPAKTRPDDWGRVWSPKIQNAIDKNRDRYIAKVRKQLEDGYDFKGSQEWVDDFLRKIDKFLAPYEKDWMTARARSSVKNYFALHFDEDDPNTPDKANKHSAGAAYILEAQDEPAPQSGIKLLENYLEEYKKELSDKSAYVLRALAGNQSKVIKVLDKLLSNPNEPPIDGLRDKWIDLLKGLVAPEILGEKLAHALKRELNYSWLSKQLMGVAVGNTVTLGQALLQGAGMAGPEWAKGYSALAHTAAYATGWVSVWEQGLNAKSGLDVKRPVIWEGSMRSDFAKRAAVGLQNSGARNTKSVRVSFLTDSEEVLKAKGDLKELMAKAKSIAVGGANVQAMIKANPDAFPLLTGGLPRNEAELLFKKQMLDARSLMGKLKGMRATAPGALREISTSTAGHLALAGVIVNSIGLFFGQSVLNKVEAELDEKNKHGASEEELEQAEHNLLYAQLYWADSISGLSGAAMEGLAVGAKYMAVSRAGAGALTKFSIASLEFGASLAGFCGGMLNAYISVLKGMDARERGLTGIKTLHYAAAISFFGFGAIAGRHAIKTVVGALVRVAVGSAARAAAAQGAVVVAGAAGAAGAAVGWVPVAGWVFLLAGVGFTLWAVWLEPTPLEEWASHTWFGKGEPEKRFANPQEQEAALYHALGIAAQPKEGEAEGNKGKEKATTHE